MYNLGLEGSFLGLSTTVELVGVTVLVVVVVVVVVIAAVVAAAVLEIAVDTTLLVSIFNAVEVDDDEGAR